MKVFDNITYGSRSTEFVADGRTERGYLNNKNNFKKSVVSPDIFIRSSISRIMTVIFALLTQIN